MVAPDLDVEGTTAGCEDYSGLADNVNETMKNATGGFPCQAAGVVLDCAETFKSLIHGHRKTMVANLDRAFMRLTHYFRRK